MTECSATSGIQAMNNRVEGIVVRSIPYGEGHKIVHVLTVLEGAGKVSILVKGAQKPKSRYGLLAQPLVRGEFIYFKGTSSTLGTLSHGDVHESYARIRSDLDLMAYAAYALELADRAIPDEEAGAYLYGQIRALLDRLEDRSVDPEILMQTFEMKIVELMGYAPDLSCCAHCGRADADTSFALSGHYGGLLCPTCFPRDTAAVRLAPVELKLVRHYRDVNCATIGEYNVPPAIKSTTKRAVRRLLDAHLQLELKSRKFLDSIVE